MMKSRSRSGAACLAAGLLLAAVLGRPDVGLSAEPAETAKGSIPHYESGTLLLKSLPPLPEARIGSSAAILDDTILWIGGMKRASLAGGLKADEASNTAWLFKRDKQAGKDAGAWAQVPLEIPIAFAAGAVVSAREALPQKFVRAMGIGGSDNVYCTFGGIDKEGALSGDVILFHLADGKIVQRRIGRLPKPIAMAAAVAFKRDVVLVGGVDGLKPPRANGSAFSIAQADLVGDGADLAFVEHEGRAVIAPALVSQDIEMSLLGGWERGEAGRLIPSGAVWSLVFKAGRLVWKPRAVPPAPLGLTGAAALGQAHVMAVGQVDPKPAAALADLFAAASPAAPSPVWSYHVYTDRWVRFPDLHLKAEKPDGESRETTSPFVSPVLISRGTEVVALNGLASSADNQSPGGTFSLKEKLKTLTGLDYVVIALYFLAMLWIGWHCSKQEQTGKQYFIGGRKIPFWASAISVYATGTSAVSFMAVPALTYKENLVYLVQPLLTAFLIILFVYPVMGLLRRLEVTTIYEYLNQRFNHVVQLLGSVLALLWQIGGRMSTVILLPAMGMHAVTGMDRTTSILIMGLITIVYTWSGGMKAVIWTDLVQAVLKFGGALFCLIWMISITPGGFSGYVEAGARYGKFDMFDFTFDLTVATFWMAVVRAISDGMCWVSDQANLQRIFGTESPKEARKTVLLSAFLTVPGAIVFFGLGTALFYFYRGQPESLRATLENDKIFPLYISHQLAYGFAGLLIAALFAASMSTLSGVMNTVAAIVVRDLIRPFRMDISEERQAVIGKWVTLVAGIFSTAVALWMANADIRSMFKVFVRLAGLLGGGMPAVIMIGLFTTRVSATAVLIGLLTSLLVTPLFMLTNVHDFYYVPIAITACLIGAYASSFVFPNRKNLDGLTIHTLRLKGWAREPERAGTVTPQAN